MFTPPDWDDQPREADAASETDTDVVAEEYTISIQEFEEWTLADLIDHFFRAPRATWQALAVVAQMPRHDESALAAASAVSVPVPLPVIQPVEEARADTAVIEEEMSRRREVVTLVLRLVALGVTWWGSYILANPLNPTRTEDIELHSGLPYLLVGFLIWLAAEVYSGLPGMLRWLDKFAAGQTESVSQETTVDELRTAPQKSVNLIARIGLVVLGVVLSYFAWTLNRNNMFTGGGVIAWFASIVVWVFAFAPANWTLSAARRWLAETRQQLAAIRSNSFALATLAALAAIIVIGAHMRFIDLDDTPPEMTSDHVEKILDSDRTLYGQTNVFFANNGGREPFQMYLIAVLAQFPGLGMNFHTLKFTSALEGLIAIPLMFLLGYEVVGRDDRKLGVIAGLLLAALVAVSYWHLALSRLGLRIILTTGVTALLMLFLVRALRDNRRADFIRVGLTLGFGLYCYQAVRMLPLVIIVGVGMAFLFGFAFNAKGLRARRDLIFNTFVLLVIAAAAFVPLLSFTQQYPEDFLRRTAGRLLGDDVIQTQDAAGNIVERTATTEDRIMAFQRNLPVLMSNIRNALLMFNWKGDVAWINGAPNYPAMDTLAGTLLVVGVAAWIGFMFRQRDVAIVLIPLALFIMLLPSALSIAYPVENPSATRTSGALPMVYMIAALPLALVVRSVMRLVRGQSGVFAGVVISALVIAGSYVANADTYFVKFRESYLISSLPYSEAGKVLAGFAESDGSFGNAFMIAYPYWWDHRAIGLEAGLTDWPNGIVSLQDTPGDLLYASQRDDRYRLDPEKDLLFFYAPEDDATQAQLQEWFPDGYWQLRQSYQPENSYKLFRVPRLGQAGFDAFIQQYAPGEG